MAKKRHTWAKGILAAAKRKKPRTAARGDGGRRAHKKKKPARAHKKRSVRTSAAGRQRLLGAACGCNRRCCSAAGVRCQCRCHGRNHGGVMSNPPRSTGEPKLHVHRFSGAPTSLRYRRGGQTYEHSIGAGASILVPRRGDFIIIKGVRTGEYLEG